MNRTSLAASTLASLLLASAAKADGGTISGTVDATPPKYLGDTVVYLKSVSGTFAPKTYTMDQKGLAFAPRILVVTQGDTVKFENHDTVAHNVYSPDGEAYNLGTFKPNEEASYTFKKAGVYTQLCSVHPEMLAYVFVGQNPYAAAVDANGKYTIKDIPPGTYQLAVWNAAKLKAPEKTVTVEAGKAAQENVSIKR